MWRLMCFQMHIPVIDCHATCDIFCVGLTFRRRHPCGFSSAMITQTFRNRTLRPRLHIRLFPLEGDTRTVPFLVHSSDKYPKLLKLFEVWMLAELTLFRILHNGHNLLQLLEKASFGSTCGFVSDPEYSTVLYLADSTLNLHNLISIYFIVAWIGWRW